MSKKNQSKKLTANNLKNVLWDTLNKVREGKIDLHNADAVATQGREIIRTVNTQLRISSQSKTPVSKDVLDFNSEKEE